MKNQIRNGERGVALFFSIFALLLLTAIGAALIFMAGTETSVNSNFRQEQIAYFGAKAGLEEARARMMPSDPSTVFLSPGNANQPLFDPNLIAAPTTGNNMIYYITNPGNGAAIKPWLSTDTYYDDELCHEGYTGFNTGATPPEERCPAPPGGTWHQSFTSAIPYSGTANALPFKWARIAPKLNGSASYLSGSGSNPTPQIYNVNANATATVGGVTAAISPTTLICWDGAEEVPLTVHAAGPAISNCSQMVISSLGGLNGAKMTQVYVVTALGVSPTGARKMVQGDVALQPTTPFPYGLYATSNACPAINFNGQSPSTNSYTTVNGARVISATGGDIGSNGGVAIGNGNVGGIVGVLEPPGPPLNGTGNCANPVSINSPGGTMLGTTACPTGDNSNPPTSCYIPTPYVFPTPPAPNPIPPNKAAALTACPPVGKGKKSVGDCISPGTFGNVSETGTLYLAPGIYNMNQLSLTGNGQIIVSPPGAVTINIGGCGDATCSAANAIVNPVTIAGNGITDDTYSNDFQINYGGSGTVKIAGNGDVTAILNSPNAAIVQQGNGNWYGAILGNTVSIGGNAFFHYDRQAALAPNNSGYYSLIAYHEVPY